MPVKLEACASRVFFLMQRFQRENSRGRERERFMYLRERLKVFLINIISLEFLNCLPIFEFNKIYISYFNYRIRREWKWKYLRFVKFSKSTEELRNLKRRILFHRLRNEERKKEKWIDRKAKISRDFNCTIVQPPRIVTISGNITKEAKK